MSKATIAFILRTSKTIKKDGTHPIVLRLICNRDQRLYTTGFSMSKEDWNKYHSGKRRKGEFKDLEIKLAEIENKAIEIINKIGVFTFDRFKLAFKSPPQPEKLTDVYSCFQDYINRQEILKTKSSYQTALKSLQTFRANKLSFEDCTPDFLKSYQNFMLSKGNSLSTLGFYLRPLKAVFNIAIEDGIVSNEYYPFGKRKYKIPKSANIKKALTLSDMERFFKYNPENDSEQFAKDFFLFSYLCGGMNIKDILLLKFKNFESDKITFIRAKTSGKSNLKPIPIPLSVDAKEIISRNINPIQSPDNFLFDILNFNLTPEQEVIKIANTIRKINKYLKLIAKKIDIKEDVTTYYARHTCATILKQSGVPVAIISDVLKHSNIKTTQSYLDTIPDEILRNVMKSLTNFTKSEPDSV